MTRGGRVTTRPGGARTRRWQLIGRGDRCAGRAQILPESRAISAPGTPRRDEQMCGRRAFITTGSRRANARASRHDRRQQRCARPTRRHAEHSAHAPRRHTMGRHLSHAEWSREDCFRLQALAARARLGSTRDTTTRFALTVGTLLAPVLAPGRCGSHATRWLAPPKLLPPTAHACGCITMPLAPVWRACRAVANRCVLARAHTSHEPRRVCTTELIRVGGTVRAPSATTPPAPQWLPPMRTRCATRLGRARSAVLPDR